MHALRIRVGPAGFPLLAWTGGVCALNPSRGMLDLSFPPVSPNSGLRLRRRGPQSQQTRASRAPPTFRDEAPTSAGICGLFFGFCLPLLFPISCPRLRRRGPNHCKHAQGERRQLLEMMLKTALVRQRLLLPPLPPSAVLRMFPPLHFRVCASGAEAPGQRKHA